MKLTQDQTQMISTTINFIVELFKVLMATLLAIFVPQRCPENADQLCTLQDNFKDLTDFNKGVIGLNFLALATFLSHYIIEYKREYWCIKHLDVDESKPINNLEKEIENYQDIKKDMIKLNHHYYRSSMVLFITNIGNFVASAVLIYKFFYLDYRSITVLLTNLLLITDKMIKSLKISKKSIKETMPYSAYMLTPVVFNTIDPNFRKEIPLANIVNPIKNESSGV